MQYCLATLLILFSYSASAQTNTTDSTQIEMQPVEVKQYFNKQTILKLTSSAHTVSRANIDAQSPTSLTSAINTVAGIRMEERSPGSYRLAMRGSLIRSPFGIRNTKIYFDELPFTDASGNTYLNLIDPNAIMGIQIIKGPDGSLFGANSGGVIRINPIGFSPTHDAISLQITGGSYGLIQENLAIKKSINDKYQFSLNHSYLKSDGYRENSALNRNTFQTAQQWTYHPDATLKLLALYTNLHYQTPGGLTLQQYKDNPRAARPAGGQNLSAIDQKAAIYNNTFYSGISHNYKISSRLTHFIGVFGSYTDFENPFITNYEYRIEKNLGTRTFISYDNLESIIPFQFQLGLEAIKGWNSINNFDNYKGVATNTQAKDGLDNEQLNIFARAQVDLTNKWLLEGSLGLNKNNIHYETLFPTTHVNKGEIAFKNVWMPRITSSYEVTPTMALRASISKGYSPPTIAEVRASDNVINVHLLAESGINYEIGYKLKSKDQHWLVDLSAYSYQMNNGIVRQLNDAGKEFYNNAGEMNQKGIELSLWTFWKFNNQIIKSVQFNLATALNHYRFGQYNVANNDYSANKITSVPDWTISNTLQFIFAQKFELNIYHNHTSQIPLDDANTQFSSKYDLLQARVNWSNKLSKKLEYMLFVGADNLFNEKYSLGNDINAFGGRYFNASSPSNFYAGIKLSL